MFGAQLKKVRGIGKAIFQTVGPPEVLANSFGEALTGFRDSRVFVHKSLKEAQQLGMFSRQRTNLVIVLKEKPPGVSEAPP